MPLWKDLIFFLESTFSLIQLEVPRESSSWIYENEPRRVGALFAVHQVRLMSNFHLERFFVVLKSTI